MDLKALGLDPPAKSPLLKQTLDYFIHQMSLVDVFQELYQSHLYFHKRFERSSEFELMISDIDESVIRIFDYTKYYLMKDAVEEWEGYEKESFSLLNALSSILTVDGSIIATQDIKFAEAHKNRQIIYSNIKKLSVANLCSLLVAGSNFTNRIFEYNMRTSPLRGPY